MSRMQISVNRAGRVDREAIDAMQRINQENQHTQILLISKQLVGVPTKYFIPEYVG